MPKKGLNVSRRVLDAVDLLVVNIVDVFDWVKSTYYLFLAMSVLAAVERIPGMVMALAVLVLPSLRC